MGKRRGEEEQSQDAIDLVNGAEKDALLQQIGMYFCWGEIEDGGLKEIVADIFLKCSATTKSGSAVFRSPLTLVINSEGGSLSETDALLDVMANSRLPIHTVGLGQCCSAGAMLLAAGAKGHRTVGPSTQIMVHQYAWGSAGKHADLVAHRKAEEDTHDKMVRFWQTHSRYRKAADVEKNLLPSEDVWLTPEDALRHGIIDTIGSIWRTR